MGGKYDGGFGSGNYKDMGEKAKEKLERANEDISRHVFITFAEEDLKDVEDLRGQAKDEESELAFDDYSVKEPYDSKNADYIKQRIRERIDKTSVTVVVLTEASAKSDWVNWEIEYSLRNGKAVIGVYKGDVPPDSLPKAFQKSHCKIIKWVDKDLAKAIENASRER